MTAIRLFTPLAIFDFWLALFCPDAPKEPVRQPRKRWETLLDMGAR